MTREQLERASEALRRASEAADAEDARQRLHEQSDHMARLAAAEQGPDHGRLARHERAIDDAAHGAGEAVAEHAEAALSAIHDYRETLEGV